MSRFILESLDSIYNFDNTIFDNMVIPEGMTKSVVVDNILFEAAELSLTYGDPDFLKKQIAVWSAGRIYSWDIIYKSINLEHDPLTTFKYTYKKLTDMDENKGHVNDITGTETGYDSRTINTDETVDTSSQRDFDKTITEDITTDQNTSSNRTDNRDISTDETDTLSKAAYDNANLATAEQTVKDSDTSDDLVSNTTGELDEHKDDDSVITEDEYASEAVVRNNDVVNAYQRDLGSSQHDVGSEATDRDTEETYETEGYKNKTPSEMIFEELKLADVNLVDIITNEFISKFCIGVY